MNSKLTTFAKFTKDLFTTGAIGNTSDRAVDLACRYIDDEPNRIYVEFGIGNGNITKKLLARIHPTSTLYAFEVKKEFCDLVAEEVQDKRLKIINDGAQNLTEYVSEQIDGIVSTIPFSFFPKELKHKILATSIQQMKVQSSFGQILYSKMHAPLFREYFPNCTVHRVIHFPIEYIHLCRKEERN